MIFYKDSANRIHCLDDASFEHLLPSGCIPISDAEALFLQTPSVTEVAATAIAAINHRCDYNGALIAAGYPDTEVKTWLKQEAEARAWLADNTAAVPLLTSMATSRGITVAELVQRVIAKADAYASAVGAVVGARQAKEDQLAAIVARNALPSSDVNYLSDDAARAAIAAVVQS